MSADSVLLLALARESVSTALDAAVAAGYRLIVTCDGEKHGIHWIPSEVFEEHVRAHSAAFECELRRVKEAL